VKRAQSFILTITLHDGIDAEHVSVGRQRTWTRAKNHAPATLMVKLHHALRDIKRMVIGQRDHTGAETNTRSSLCCSGEK
jgi:hypothetical protein